MKRNASIASLLSYLLMKTFLACTDFLFCFATLKLQEGNFEVSLNIRSKVQFKRQFRMINLHVVCVYSTGFYGDIRGLR